MPIQIGNDKVIKLMRKVQGSNTVEEVLEYKDTNGNLIHKRVEISYDANGGTGSYPTQTLTWGVQKIPIPGDLVFNRNGYFCSGWEFTKTSTDVGLNTLAPNENKTVYAIWETITYTITFDRSGGIGGNSSAMYHIEQTTSLSSMLGSVSKTGYSLRGLHLKSWESEKPHNWGPENTLYNLGSTIEGKYGTVELKVDWKGNQYTVAFNKNGGNDPSPSTKSVTFGNAYGTLATIVRNEPYSIFDGWYTAINGGTKITSSSTVNTALNHTLYARWNPTPYVITIDKNGGTGGNNSINYNVETTETIKQKAGNITKTGYSIYGWRVSDWSGAYNWGPFGTNYLPETSLSGYFGNITLTATWSANEYEVTFDSQGGSVPNPQSKMVTYQTAYGALPTVKDSNYYSFDGWYTAASGGSKITSSSIMSTASDHSLYARYLQKYPDMEYPPSLDETYCIIDTHSNEQYIIIGVENYNSHAVTCYINGAGTQSINGRIGSTPGRREIVLMGYKDVPYTENIYIEFTAQGYMFSKLERNQPVNTTACEVW